MRLKDEAARRAGLLVMGPDCGTAVVGGVGLGFANAVRPGPVGLVAASGTGAQQLMCCSTRRRSASATASASAAATCRAAVGGRSTRHGPGAARRRPGDRADRGGLQAAGPGRRGRRARRTPSRCATPVLLALLGEGQADLTDGRRARGRRPLGATWAEPLVVGRPAAACAPAGALRGLFAGGTLCDEAMVIAAAALGEIRSNIPLRPGAGRLGDGPAAPTRPRDGRLRRRRADPGPAAPDDRPAQPDRPARRRGGRPDGRGAAARRRPRPRRPPRPGRRAGPGDRGGPASGRGRRSRARRGRVAVRDGRRPAGLATPGASCCTRPAPRCSCPTPPPPGTPSPLVREVDER